MSHVIASYQPTLNTYNYGYSGTLLAQTFVVASGYTRASYVQIPLRRLGSVSGNTTVSIYATSGGVPTGGALTTATYAASSISTSGSSYYKFDFSDVAVTPGGTYAIVFDGKGTSGSNTVVWWRNTTSSYGSGTGFYKYSGGGWTNYGFDFAFVVAGYGPPASMGATSTSSVTQTSFYASSSVGSDMGTTVTSRGFCYSSSTSNPTKSDSVVNSGSGTGGFAETIGGLSGNTTYYIRSWATNAAGTSYGAVKTQKTAAVVPTGLGSTSTSSVGETSFYASSSVGGDGGATITQRGFCYSSSTSNPTTSSSVKLVSGTTGSMGATISGLSAGVTYYIRSFATNSVGTSYGSVKTQATSTNPPSVTTGSASSITYNSATVSGNVTSDHGATVTTRGICYNTTGSPTTSSPKVASGSGTGSFSSNLTGLDPDQLYYARAYATNSQGTSYGAEISFTTLSAEPSVTTTSGATGITTSSATVAGNVTSDNGAAITERGFCYSNTETTPTTSHSKAITTGTTGAMSKEITGLAIGTKYYFRAYAINERGTGYGSVSNFTTLPGNPSDLEATTNDKDEVGLTWTKGNGGAYTIIRRGLTAPANINSGTLVYQGTGTSTTDTGLAHGTTYYYRAWSATTADWSEAYSSGYSADYTTTMADFIDPENALVDDTDFATVPANDTKLYCQLSKDGGDTWTRKKYITVDTIATQSFGDGSTEKWGVLTWKGYQVNDANFRVKLIGGSNTTSYQVYKNFGFNINVDYILTGIQVQVKAAWDNQDILVYFVKVNVYYGESTLPVTRGALAYDTTLERPTYYNNSQWIPMGGGSKVTVSETQPSDPKFGDIWVDVSSN